MNTLIKNAYVVSEDYNADECYDIYIEDGVIKEIGAELSYDADTMAAIHIIDADYHYVLPGFVDMYCKVGELGYENKDNIVAESKSAAAGGYTSITTSPDTKPNIDNKTVVEHLKSKAAKHSVVHVFPYGSMTKRCEGKEIAEIGEMILAGVVALSDGSNSIEDAAVCRNIFQYSLMFNTPIITFCQDANLAADGVINKGYMSTKTGLKGIPVEAEEVIVGRNLIIADRVGAKIHISHVSTEGSINLIRQFKNAGTNVTCSTCPHYFSLSEQAVDDYNTFAKVSPPLRTQKDMEAIIAALQEGVIDAIATGHTPVAMDKKIIEFDKAAYGMASTETAFALSFTNLVETKKISLLALADIMSKNPAHFLGLPNKGQVKVGYDADLTIVDTLESFKVDASKFLSKAKYSPFDGYTLRGKVLKTLVKGTVVYDVLGLD